MNPENWQKVEELLNAALELEPDGRERFLAKINAPEIRREVASLLAGEREAEKFLASPAVAFSADFFNDEDAPDALIDQQIGNYKIIGTLGRGGMGAVYLGERVDGKFSQKVAVKLLKRELNTPDIRRRFAYERQILAALAHPNIARLLDAGTTADGLPYLVMEYVEGAPIDEFCNAQKLDLNERLELFRTVCEAVAVAHRNLIVHRDLKPSNILVNKDGVPKLLDFGISKLLTPEYESESDHTVTRLGAMTPEYASPEQLRGESVTTATDVYSLGVILYELLTAHRPFELKTRSAEEIVRAVCETEPERPSSVVSSPLRVEKGRDTNQNKQRTTAYEQRTKPAALRGDLDNIVLKALKKEPARRYSSVEQFSEDISRHLSNLPVRARPDTLHYRATKFINRNKVAVLASILIFVTLISGIIATLWQARRAEANQARAEKRFADVRGLSNALLNDIAPKIERLEGSTEARAALVAQSLKYLDSLAVESGDDLTLQAELAAAYEKVGILQGDSRKPSLSDFRGAIASLEKAQAIRRRLLENNPQDTENRRLLADNLRLLGIRRMSQSDVEGGIRDGKEAVSIYEKLVAENPAVRQLQTALLESRIEDAASYVDLGRFNEAIPQLQQTASRIEELRRIYGEEAETSRILAKCRAYLGHSLSWENRQTEAEAEMTRALEITEALAARHPNDASFRQDLWRIYQVAAGIYEEVDDARAFELCEKARKTIEETIVLDPANAQARHNLAMTFSRLGVSAFNLGKPDQALGYIERAAAILSELQARDPLNRGYDQDLSTAHKRIGDAKYKRRDLAGAFEAYEKSRALLEKQFAGDLANTRTMRNLAIACRDLGWAHRDYLKTATGQARQNHLESALENYRRSLDVWQQARTRNALSKTDDENLEEVRTAVEELEKMR